MNDEFLPQLQRQPGFVAYYAMDAGDGTWASVSIFEEQSQAEWANTFAAQWAGQSLTGKVAGPPEILAGPVVCSSQAVGVTA